MSSLSASNSAALNEAKRAALLNNEQIHANSSSFFIPLARNFFRHEEGSAAKRNYDETAVN
jgi:hypothetical protein